jgi:hypothetical protein
LRSFGLVVWWAFKVQGGAGGGGGGSIERAYPSGYNVVPSNIPPFVFHFKRQKIFIFFLSPQQMTVETDAMYSSDSDLLSDDGVDAPLIVSSEGQTSASQIKVWKLKVKGLKGVVKCQRSTSPLTSSAIAIWTASFRSRKKLIWKTTE